jgi:osmoprotectant transport system ATP-binding protein
LKRLSVTGISSADLVHPPVVTVDDSLSSARDALGKASARWAVVLDKEGRLHGWIAREQATGDGDVYSHGHRMTAWVPASASLKTAYAEMLQHDAGWIAVLDGDHYLGVLTPASLHAALRRSVDAETEGARIEDVVLDSAGEPAIG